MGLKTGISDSKASTSFPYTTCPQVEETKVANPCSNSTRLDVEDASTGRPSAVEEEKAGHTLIPDATILSVHSYTPSHSVSVPLSVRSFWVVGVIRNSRVLQRYRFCFQAHGQRDPHLSFLTMETLILCSPCAFIWIISLSFCCKTSICDWIRLWVKRVVLASCAWRSPGLMMPSLSLGMEVSP